MLAASGVDAAFGKQQSFYRTPRHQMRGDNFIYIGFRDMPIPNGFRIDDHGWPMFALVQAASLINADGPLQAGNIHSLLEPRLQLRFAVGITAGARAAGFALVDADKYVPLILCQEISLPKNSVVIFHHKGSQRQTHFAADVDGPNPSTRIQFRQERVHILSAGSLSLRENWSRMEKMDSNNLTSLKDDMIAFIEGHGMRHFPALIPEDTPRVWWSDPEMTADNATIAKESWKDFVEMAKTAGAPLVCIGEDSVDRTTLELLSSELQDMSSTEAPAPEMDKLNRLFLQIGKVGHLELAFAHQGILFVHETQTEWYREYRAMVNTVDSLQELIENALEDDDEDDE